MLQHNAGIGAVALGNGKPIRPNPVVVHAAGDHVSLAVFQCGGALQAALQHHLSADTGFAFLFLDHLNGNFHRQELSHGI